MKRFAGLLLCLSAALSCSEARAEKKRPMTIDDLFRFKRVSDPQISPDGKTVVYVVATADLAGNKSSSNLWLAPTDKGKPRQLTTAKAKDHHPRWSPDGKRILFESTRSGASQLWVIDLRGGEARHLTAIASEASTGIWSPDGKWIAFVSAAYPEYSRKPYKESNALNKKRKEEIEKNPVKAKVFTKLFFRHWDEWVEDKRKHIFVMPAAGGEPKDVTPSDRDAYPTSDTFSVGDDFTFSPDSKYLLYTATPERDEAWSTNYDICRVPITGGKIECLTKANKAADGAPRFSPNGKLLAYRAQKRPGYEADRWQLMIVDTDASGTIKGQPRSLTAKFDGWVEEFTWQDDETICFLAEEEAYRPAWEVSVKQGKVKRFGWLTEAFSPFVAGYCSSLTFSRGGAKCACALASLRFPPTVCTALQATSGPVVFHSNIDNANTKLLAELNMPTPKSITIKGAGGTPMQMWILKPPGFDPKKKWPLAFLVHGGPQGSWEDGWSYRWNPELWAAQGYVVALPNPRGSTGFGQRYIDEINGDWGGKCYDDLMAGLAYLEKQPYIDKDRMAAAGASFGGYMMNWFQGHTTKFKTLITHCGVYNFDSMYALTDELWFDEWEHGGPPWAVKRDSYEKHSPHRFAKNFKTPMLIIHNDLDFRVPVAEGLQLFTTLQRLKVPSKMINFPDEGHWVLKPANSAYWHKEVFAWLKKYAPPGGR
jgi:dipeptidyl aminopeptidase/acylaminoacyl peptidase